ncbi:hypothetical protein [Natrinema sp. DC36]|uniref:hypothetical protein n=1 Tax=Natrinema sp. DC36 TaxID=2878680 RepID=UPI001CF042C8|nr:hypothetical protein [Natrinema sp. DC36]
MYEINIINEAGERDTQQIESRDVTLIVDGEEFSPTVVERIEYDDEGTMDSTKTVCGETENRRGGEEGPDITVEGIVVEDELSDLKGLKRATELEVISPIDKNDVTVKRTTIEMNTDIIHIIPNGEEPQLAFPFQLQLQYPEA